MTILNDFNGEYDHNPMDGMGYTISREIQNGFMILILC
jgi:hypothetical protein